MTIKAKVFGAGSIGNHLTQACRRAGWEVCVVDNDANALNRMKEEIYPKRYGAWDDGIKLYKTGEDPKGGYDVILIGTPPDAHLKIGLHVLKEEAPKVLQMEKPLCSPTLEGLKKLLLDMTTLLRKILLKPKKFYHPEFLKMSYRWIANFEAIGRIYLMRIHGFPRRKIHISASGSAVEVPEESIRMG